MIFISVSTIVFVQADNESFLRSNNRTTDLKIGQQVYDQNCVVCHGPNGDGNGKEAHRFETKPGNFTRGEYKFKSTYPGSLPFSSDLYHSITNGVRGTAMLAQLHLTDEQRWAVVEYIKTFSGRFEGKAISMNEAIVVPDPPGRTTELISSGGQLYRDAGCVKCHGESGKGDGPSANELRDSQGNSVLMPDLTKMPRKMGDKPEDIYRLLVTGMEGTPMPSYYDVLDESQLWAVVYYLESIVAGRRENCMGMMGRMMDMVGEECIGMQIDMPAARARMMGRRGPGMMRNMGRE
ncbi:MAG: cytochrome c [Candidatus Marinimicrobia bacterium]|nr:cytochrome c [Candidatus Neomarinimicrobiota bacterium]